MINLAIIGCGRIFNKHFSSINKNKNFKLIAICDTDIEKLDNFNIKNVKKYLYVKEMLKKEKIDMVSILTPSGYHLKNFTEVSKYVKNILIEKPLTTSLNDAYKIFSLSKKNNNNVFVVMQNRFNKPILKLKELIANKRLGKIFMSSVRVRWHRDEKYYNLAKWRGTKKYDGGILFNQAAHHIDMLSWLNGPVKKIFSLKNNLVVKNIEHEDTLVSTILFKSGAIGSLEVTVGTRPDDLEGSISVLGTKGSVEISGFSMDQIKHWNFYKKINKPKFKKHDHIYGIGHIQLYKEIFKAINKKKNICPTLEDGLQNVKLIENFYKSIQQ